jgi:SAM-dependent methyltransferase
MTRGAGLGRGSQKKEGINSSLLSHGLEVDMTLGNYNAWIFENIKEAVAGNVLELGCGLGTMIDFIKIKARSVRGVEIDPSFAAYSKKKFAKDKKVKIIRADTLKTGKLFRAASFDTVVTINVLEHIKDDAKAVRIMHRLLKNSGRLAVFVPAFKSLYGALDKNAGHYRRYDKKSMRGLLEGAGFEIKKLYYMNFPGFFGWYLNTVLLRRDRTPEMQASFFSNYLVPLVSFFERYVKPPVGQSLLVIAQKKPAVKNETEKKSGKAR